MAIASDLFLAARNLRTPTWVFDIDKSCILFANEAACEVWNAETEEELRGRDMSHDMSNTVAKRLKQYQVDFVERDATFNEMWTIYPNKVPTSVMVVFSGFRLPDGRMGMQCEVLANAEDEPENLRSAEALLYTDVMIALFSTEGPVLYMNPSARNAVSKSTTNIQDIFVNPEDCERLLSGLKGGGDYHEIAKIKTASGIRWFDLTAKNCSDAATGAPAILLTAIDVSELKIARDKARYMADRDQLTGCFNRTFLHQHVELIGSGQDRECALLYFDIDRFKQINDTFGHDVGDTVIKEIATRARQTVRDEDIVVRLGGDEFVILLDKAPEDGEFISTVERIFSWLSVPVSNSATRVDVSVSMGVARFSPNDTDIETALRRADTALYASKHGGRGRYTIYNREMGIAAKARTQIELEIKQGLERGEFGLFYQPRFDLETGTIIGCEGLARWKHPRRGWVMPREFIAVCEETGMINQLGLQIVEAGLERVAQWHREGLELRLSLNISPRQFSDDGLMRLLQTAMQNADFPKYAVELEITESVLVGDHDEIEERLRTITDMGYLVAIDDFGTGYSNLSYISRFPLHCLKIDQSFVHQLPKSGPIVRLILALGQQIDVTTVAEGVETVEQYEWLREHGCDQVQGYFISPPVPLEDFEALLYRPMPAVSGL